MRYFRTAVLLVILTALAACQDANIVGTDPKPNASDTHPGLGILDPQKGPAYTGYILGNDGETPVKIQYQVVNGHAIYDGDVSIGAPSEVAKTAEELLARKHNVTASALHRDAKSWWSGGVVPVRQVFAPNNLQAALSQIQQQVPGIKFVTYTGQARYLAIRNSGDGSYYYGGCSGSECTVYIGSSGASKAIIMHEVGHALGFQHEVRRCDRNSYIRMIDTNPYPEEFALDCTSVQMGNYDLNSIMHYNSREFGRLHFTNLNGQEVQGYWGRTTLSAGDVAAWQRVYTGTTSGTVTGTTANTGEYTGPYNLRSGPGTSYSVAGTIGGGVQVTIACQSTGTTHTGPWGSTNIWDKLSTGKWISDAFVYTGSSSRVAPSCS